jgi:hypothetical protein
MDLTHAMQPYHVNPSDTDKLHSCKWVRSRQEYFCLLQLFSCQCHPHPGHTAAFAIYVLTVFRHWLWLVDKVAEQAQGG